MADTKPTVHEAWSAVMAAVQAVGKTGRNRQQNYDFRGVDAVVNAVGPALRTHGVIVAPTTKEAHYRDIEVGQNRTNMREVTVKVRYSIIGPAGDVLTVPDEPDFGIVWGESMDSGDKGTAKAMSVAYRIFLLQALTIPTGDPDPDEQSHERAAPRQQTSGAPAASKTKRDRIKGTLDELGGDALDRLKAWVVEQGLPDPDRLTDKQADKVLAWLAADAAGQHTEPPQPELPGQEAVSQAYADAMEGQSA